MMDPKYGCAKFVATILQETVKEHIIIYWASLGLALSHGNVQENRKLKSHMYTKLITLESN